MSEAASLPTGTVTFFFSDIEGSTRLLQSLGQERYRMVVEEHHRLVRDAIRASGGLDLGTESDSFFAVFRSAHDAALVAAETQRALASSDWPFEIELRVRIGLHTGEGILGGDNYVGLDVNRGARIAAAGHGGQVLLSEATRALIAGSGDGLQVRDLGEHRLKDLSRPEHLYQLVIPGLPEEFPPLKSLEARPHNLPLQLSSFVGRRKELDELRSLLAQTRLLTLTGPGGTGKTRLSIQLAADATDQFRDGVFFCPLSTVFDPSQVASAIAESLNLREMRGDARSPLQRVIDYLANKDALLVLDNFEQVVDAAPILTDILKSAERVKILVTSRAPLHLYGEREFPVPPLDLPDPRHLPGVESLSKFEAIALFIERAVSVKPDFRMTNENAQAVAEICARLDGLPLAIELAAARVRLLTPDALLARLGERLRVLVGGSRDLPERQRTLRRAIEWSYELLDESEKDVFAQLGVFAGSFPLNEAETVCRGHDPEHLDGDILDEISSLVDKSLVRRVEDEGTEPRYHLLETIREYALEKLRLREDADDIRRRHAQAYSQLAEAAAGELHTFRQRQWLDRLERDHDNLRAAHDWAVDGGEREIALRLSTALWRFWQMRGHLYEGRRRMERALALSTAEDKTALRASALQGAGSLAYWQHDLKAQEAYHQQALALWRSLGDKAGIAGALYDAGFGGDWSNFRENRPMFEESLALYREIGDRHGEAKARWGMGVIHVFCREYDEAEKEYDAALGVFEEFGDAFMLLWSLEELGVCAMETGRLEEAKKRFGEALRLGAEAGDVSAILFLLDNFATVAHRERNLERVARLRAAVTTIEAASGAGLVDAQKAATGVELIEREGLTEGRLQEIWAEGERMSLDDAIAYALEEQA